MYPFNLFAYSGGMVLVALLIGVAVLWLQGASLWSAANKKQGWWFFFLLVTPFYGLLPLIYLIRQRLTTDKWFN